MATITDLCTAIVSAINSGTFARRVVAERTYTDEFPLEEIGIVRVTVIEGDESGEPGDFGGSWLRHVDVNARISAKLSPEPGQPANASLQEIGVLRDLCEAIRVVVCGAALPSGVVLTESAFAYDREAIREQLAFFAAMTFTFDFFADA